MTTADRNAWPRADESGRGFGESASRRAPGMFGPLGVRGGNTRTPPRDLAYRAAHGDHYGEPAPHVAVSWHARPSAGARVFAAGLALAALAVAVQVLWRAFWT